MLNIPLARVDQVTKLIPHAARTSRSTRRSRRSPTCSGWYDDDPEIARADRLSPGGSKGTTRNVGTHAAGVVIADRPLERLVPLQKLPNKDKDKEVVTTQWDMGDLEKVGLLKMDFLGLRNLTSLDAAVRLDRARPAASRSTSIDLPLDDQETYELLQRGDAKGVFQLESAGIRDLLSKMKPDNFADLIAIHRPLPPRPARRRHGRRLRQPASTAAKQADYPHPVMKEVLDETYGVMVYQEQVMRILNRLGGIELSQAYALHQGDQQEEDRDHRPGPQAEFVDGADERRAWRRTRPTKIFDLIVFFGGYGFNKSHIDRLRPGRLPDGLPEGPLPAEFMAALLSSEIDGAKRDKFFVEHIDDCRRMGIEVLPPDVNEGEVDVPGRRARARSSSAWRRSRGSGYKAVEAIVAAREAGGPFASLDDFFERVPLAIGHPGVRRDADQGRRVRRPRRPPEPVARRPAPRRAGRPGRPGRPQARPAEPLRRLRVRAARANGQGNGKAVNGHARSEWTPRGWRTCPRRSGWPTRSGSWGCTCPATP